MEQIHACQRNLSTMQLDVNRFENARFPVFLHLSPTSDNVSYVRLALSYSPGIRQFWIFELEIVFRNPPHWQSPASVDKWRRIDRRPLTTVDSFRTTFVDG